MIYSFLSRCPAKLIRFMIPSTNRKRSVVIVLIFFCLTMITINYNNTRKTTNYTWSFKSELNHVNTSLHLKSVRICCLILTIPKNFLTRAQAIKDTWAPRCDRYFFVSEYSENNTNLEHMPLLPLGDIKPGRKHLTQKITAAFLFIYEHYFNDFDWFLKADDDTYIIVENLRGFLRDKDATEPVTFGYNFKRHVEGGYHSGGASYVLSREALQRFHKGHQVSKDTSCRMGTRGVEDVEIAQCLRGQGVYVGTSLDEHDRELFHPLSFRSHFSGMFPPWMERYASNPLRAHYNCCSDRTISFHYVTPIELYLFDFILYRVRLG